MKCWILCNERSGSTMLCNLLNDTKLFPVYVDSRLTDHKGPLQKGRAFDEWLRLFMRDNSGVEGFLKNPPLCLKCLQQTYVDVFGQLSADQLEEIFPNINYILLKRKDIYAHAVSVYFSKTFQKWHLYNKEEYDRYMKLSVAFDIDIAMEAYQSVITFQENWKGFLGNRKPIEVFYEDLVSNPTLAIFSILDHLELPHVEVKVSNRTLPMTRPESQHYASLIKQLVRKTPIYL